MTNLVTPAKTPSDDVSLVVDGKAISGWTSVRITRGIERCPSDYELLMTEKYPDSIGALQIKPQDPFQLKIGADLVMTGFVDIVNPSVSKRSHAVHVVVRSKCQDVVDCSAEWAGGAISGNSIDEVAQKLCDPYGVKVKLVGDAGDPIPVYQLNQGETAFEVIEKLARYRQLLVYDDVDGALVLSSVGVLRASSGFREGVNVESADAVFSAHQRFQTYISYGMSTESFNDPGEGDYAQATVTDQAVKRHRVRKIVCPVSGPLGQAFAEDRVIWEMARRAGRSYAVSIETDSWRDAAGILYTPNTLVRLELPTLKLPDVTWLISEVTYRKGDDGTRCSLVVMPPQAFIPEPSLDFQISAELLGLVGRQ